MGQKVNPIGMRLGITKTWSGKWYADKRDYPVLLAEDLMLQKYIKSHMKHAGISLVEVERAAQRVKVTIHSSRPGIIIGRKGESADALKEDLVRMTKRDVTVNIKEVKRPEIDAQLLAENIATQLERRIAFRRAIKRSLASAMRLNIQGCKIMVAGRLNGAEMSRREWVREGRVPLHTLRADIDYGTAEALTTYGIIGVKVWIYKGEDYNQPRLVRRRGPGGRER
ncbi:MAG: 30S ribosomal protein S3 [SAR324 cluster bacterium]|nr:30S ribosomal protein S3 [SAR324 cluster bacterium]MCZ6532526.1 30S ribosomal protein S3 [SAR324 cluster bacterium]MCZ6558886.1 30S ribosomal protein S3 [SAR324 cluster bacterium]MCZ6627077.1 30S ribosomal protein S3 [SAR324 cluster bacterium]MCZ6646368.1 30S ribosomal protein S3 [SAR324 cluster bacterium]